MTQFRTEERILADFRRLNPDFRQIERRNDILPLLFDDPMGAATASLTGNGPVLFDLGVLNGSEWESVRRFLDSRTLLTDGARAEFAQLESDLRAADADGDGFVDNREIVSFAQAHSDRWPSVALFRSAADAYLSRLPNYVAQSDLSRQDVSRLWGLMNHYGQQWRDAGVDGDRLGTVSGLTLDGFPSNDPANPPDLIRRAAEGRLSPEELGAVRQLLRIEPNADGTYTFDAPGSVAPLSPVEIDLLGRLAEGAARDGRDFHGMTLVSGEDEHRFFSESEDAVRACQDELAWAGSVEALQGAFDECRRRMEPLETSHAGRMSVSVLAMRAYQGDLTPAETGALRVWMRAEAERQGMTCDGALDCLGQGAMNYFQNIAENPGRFLARNGAFLATSSLYRRVLRSAAERRLSNLCGGPVSADAYRDYNQFLREEAARQPLLSRLPREALSNPFLQLAIFNTTIAPLKDTGDLKTDIATDAPLMPLFFEGFETYDAFLSGGLQRFAAQNPGVCRPAGEAVGEPVPSPETVTESPREFSRPSDPGWSDAFFLTMAGWLAPGAIAQAGSVIAGYASSLWTGFQTLMTEPVVPVPLIFILPQDCNDPMFRSSGLCGGSEVIA